jgi:2-haloacid dehalogenase
MSEKIETVIFDLGGVLIDWNPRYLYRKLLKDEEQITWFLENVCTSEWNDMQDAGRSFQDATQDLISRFPEWKEPISAWYGRWQETIGGPIPETVNILQAIKDSNRYNLYALTNWSAETFPWALDNFDFLHWFKGIVVSGTEKTRKPFPEFYQILFDRYNINPAKSIFIDDNVKNIEGARAVGLPAIHFQDPGMLKDQLTRYGVSC